MGQFLVSYPDIADIDLVFDATETKKILIFFYPSYQARIDKLDITKDARRLAQTMLIAAIDASQTISMLDVLVNSLRRAPTQSVSVWARKLSIALTRRWFKNAMQKDLMKAEVYNTVRESIAYQCGMHFRNVVNGLAFRTRIASRYACA